MKSFFSLALLNVLYLSSSMLQVEAFDFFSVHLAPCGGPTYKNHVSQCDDGSVITPNGHRIYRDYHEKSFIREDVHKYGKVYIPDGAKWKVKKDELGSFDPKSSQIKLWHKPKTSNDLFLLATIDQDGSISYSSGLEYKYDGAIKIPKWFRGADPRLPELGYNCTELPCKIPIEVTISHETGWSGKKTMRTLLYIWADGRYVVLNAILKATQKTRRVHDKYLLEIYSPVGNDLNLANRTADFHPGIQAQFKDIYHSIYGYPKDWL